MHDDEETAEDTMAKGMGCFVLLLIAALAGIIFLAATLVKIWL